MFLDGVGDLRLTVGGSAKIAFQSGGVLPLAPLRHNQAGTASAPAYSWNSDQNTGLYNTGQNDNLRFSTGGVEAGYFDSGQDLYVTNELFVPRIESGMGKFYVSLEVDGDLTMTTGTILCRADATVPDILSIAASDAPTTGFSFDGTTIRFISNNSQVVALTPTFLRSGQDLQLIDGSEGSPSYTFTNEIDTGMYNPDTDKLAFATGGTEAGFFDSNQDLFVTNAITLGGELIGTPDAITATSTGVAASVTTLNTEVTTNDDNDLDNVTLADGASGQVKHIYCVVSFAGDTWKITPATMLGGSIITFGDNSVGDGCTLVFADTEGWVVVGNNGGTIS